MNVFQTNQCSQLICDDLFDPYTNGSYEDASYEELKAVWHTSKKNDLVWSVYAMIIDVLPGTKCGLNAVS